MGTVTMTNGRLLRRDKTAGNDRSDIFSYIGVKRIAQAVQWQWRVHENRHDAE
jgi:hypothetical protein